MRSNPQLPRLKSVIGKDGVVVLINLIKNEKSLHKLAARPVSGDNKGHFKKVFVELKKRFPQNQLYSQQVWTCWINIKQNYRYHRSNYWARHLGFIERSGRIARQKNASAQAHPEQPSVLDSSHVSLAPQNVQLTHKGEAYFFSRIDKYAKECNGDRTLIDDAKEETEKILREIYAEEAERRQEE